MTKRIEKPLRNYFATAWKGEGQIGGVLAL